jgi:hypothetical protein
MNLLLSAARHATDDDDVKGEFAFADARDTPWRKRIPVLHLYPGEVGRRRRQKLSLYVRRIKPFEEDAARFALASLISMCILVCKAPRLHCF